MMKTATPSITGTANKNIIVEPCIVNSSLYRWAPMRALSGRASCTRIASASTPPSARNRSAVTM